jgi:hypothetical protein
MSRIAFEPRQPVEIKRRRYMTSAEKVRRWEELGKCCTVCHLPCDPYGSTVVWDHRLQLAIGGTNDLSNMECHHNSPECSGAKTRSDATARAKVKRIIAKENGETKLKRPIKSRGFDKTKTRRLDGTIKERA